MSMFGSDIMCLAKVLRHVKILRRLKNCLNKERPFACPTPRCCFEFVSGSSCCSDTSHPLHGGLPTWIGDFYSTPAHWLVCCASNASINAVPHKNETNR